MAPAGTQFSQVSVDQLSVPVTPRLDFGKIVLGIDKRLPPFEVRFDLGPIRNCARIELQRDPASLGLFDLTRSLRLLVGERLQFLAQSLIPLPRVGGNVFRNAQIRSLTSPLLQLIPLRPRAGLLLDLGMPVAQVIDLIVQALGTLDRLRHGGFHLMKFLWPQRAIFDVLRQLLEFREQSIDRGLRATLFEQFVRLATQFGNHLVRAAGSAETAAEQGRLQTLMLQARLTLTELIESQREDRLEQAAILVIEQLQPTGIVEIGWLAVELDRHLVFVPLAASQFDESAVTQFERRHAGHLTLVAEVVRRPRREVEQQPAQEFEQRRFTRFVRTVDDLQPVTEKDEIALMEVAEAIDVQLPNLHVWVPFSWTRWLSSSASAWRSQAT